MNDVFLFSNPIAGRGRGKTMAQRISEALSGAGFTVRAFDKPADAIADDEFRTDAPPVAAITIGGDGTLRAAVERMLAFVGNNAVNVPPLLVIPLGTANLMARHLGIKWNDRNLEREVQGVLMRRQIVSLDAGRANERLFLLMASVGIDAAVVHELDRLRKGPIDLTSYAVPALLAIQSYRYPELRVEIDGKVVWENRPAMAFVGNTAEYGTGFPILTQAKSDDGMLDVCILPCRSRAQVIQLMLATTTGDHIREDGVIYTKARTVRIESPQSAPIQIDGESSGHTPLSIELLPSRLAFIVP